MRQENKARVQHRQQNWISKSSMKEATPNKDGIESKGSMLKSIAQNQNKSPALVSPTQFGRLRLSWS